MSLMNVVPIKDTAFAKYLRSIPREEAAAHLFQCLVQGPSSDNMAWELYQEVHGEKKFSTTQIYDMVEAMLDSIGVEV